MRLAETQLARCYARVFNGFVPIFRGVLNNETARCMKKKKEDEAAQSSVRYFVIRAICQFFIIDWPDTSIFEGCASPSIERPYRRQPAPLCLPIAIIAIILNIVDKLFTYYLLLIND